MKNFLAKQAELLWKFLGFFQDPALRRMHALLIALVLLQVLSSASMSMRLIPFSDAPFAFMGSRYHILAGLATLVLSLIMTAYCFSHRGLRRYFPYLWGDISRIKKDIQDARQGKVPAPAAGGLATTVQGLGFGALWLAVFSGAMWLCLWQLGYPAGAQCAITIHKIVVKLLILYFIGHGSMAMLHFVMWQRKSVKS